MTVPEVISCVESALKWNGEATTRVVENKKN